MIKEIDKMKYDKLYDLICRACANGTSREVAAAIAVHWNPPISIGQDGKMFIHVERNEEYPHV